MKKQKTPRKLSLVKFDFTNLPEKYHSQYPFKKNESILFLGEIPQMKGHCVVARSDGTLSWAWHTDNFVELTKEEC